MSTDTATMLDEKPTVIDKLWAGKYKTAEDMETALLSQNKEVYKLLDEKKLLAAKIQENLVPESYKVPDGLDHIKGEIDDLKAMARASGLTQDLFVKMISEINTKRIVEYDRFLESKKALGEANVTVLDDYVKKNYPESLHQTILNKLITEPDARKQAMDDRDKRLNSRVSGMDSGNPGSGITKDSRYDGEQELAKLAEEYERNPSNTKIKDKLINLATEIGQARQERK